MWLPFLYLGIGAIIGLAKIEMISKVFSVLSNIALIVLMMVIGANVGVDQNLIANIGWIGMNCVFLALGAIVFSVIFSVLLEKTIVPLEKFKEILLQQRVSVATEVGLPEEKPEEKKSSIFMLGIPLYLISGVGIGYFLIPEAWVFLLDYLMMGSLMIIYLGVGISLGSDLSVFAYVKLLGWRVLLFSCAIFLGSLVSGAIMGPLLSLPWSTSITATMGMSYYSVTGAYMTQTLGSEAGIYGFMVNVLREFLTVLLLPLLVRIGKSAPIAGGAAGNMDTMLLPVTRFIGAELGLVALITGTILTLLVPFLLPVLGVIL